MTMATIDWEKLGDAANDGADCQSPCECSFDRAARAVIAALRDQGLVVVRRDDVDRITDLVADLSPFPNEWEPEDALSFNRLCKSLGQ